MSEYMTTGNLDNDACLLDPPLTLWDKTTQKNCMVEDCFSSRVFENTIYYRLEIAPSVFAWRRDDQVEEQAIFHGYDAEYLCTVYRAKFGKPYPGTATSIKATIENLLSKKADVSHARTRDGGREIIGDLTDMIVEAMHWRES